MVGFLNNYLFFSFLTTFAVSDNLITFLIGWVGLNISLYGTLLKSFNSYNKEITVKYFLAGSVVTMFLLVAALFYFFDNYTLSLVSASYLFNFEDCLESVDKIGVGIGLNRLQVVYFSIILSTFLFKFGSFPFHFYISDIYQALNARETMFMYTVALKVAVFLSLLKILDFFCHFGNFSADFLLFSGLTSMSVSSFSSIKQYKLSKFWAYSYLNSIGFTLMALSAGLYSDFGEVSFYSSKVYFFSYIVTWFGILDFISKFSIKNINSRVSKSLYYISDLLYFNSLRYSNFKKSRINSFGGYDLADHKIIYLVIFLVSLFGLPPFLGFFSKALVYFDLASNLQTNLAFVVSLLLTPLISFAYLKLIVYCVVPGGTFGSYFKVSGDIIFVFEKKVNRFGIFNYISASFIVILLPLLFFMYTSYNPQDWSLSHKLGLSPRYDLISDMYGNNIEYSLGFNSILNKENDILFSLESDESEILPKFRRSYFVCWVEFIDFFNFITAYCKEVDMTTNHHHFFLRQTLFSYMGDRNCRTNKLVEKNDIHGILVDSDTYSWILRYFLAKAELALYKDGESAVMFIDKNTFYLYLDYLEQFCESNKSLLTSEEFIKKSEYLKVYKERSAAGELFSDFGNVNIGKLLGVQVSVSEYIWFVQKQLNVWENTCYLKDIRSFADFLKYMFKAKNPDYVWDCIVLCVSLLGGFTACCYGKHAWECHASDVREACVIFAEDIYDRSPDMWFDLIEVTVDTTLDWISYYFS